MPDTNPAAVEGSNRLPGEEHGSRVEAGHAPVRPLLFQPLFRHPEVPPVPQLLPHASRRAEHLRGARGHAARQAAVRAGVRELPHFLAPHGAARLTRQARFPFMFKMLRLH